MWGPQSITRLHMGTNQLFISVNTERERPISPTPAEEAAATGALINKHFPFLSFPTVLTVPEFFLRLGQNLVFVMALTIRASCWARQCQFPLPQLQAAVRRLFDTQGFIFFCKKSSTQNAQLMQWSVKVKPFCDPKIRAVSYHHMDVMKLHEDSRIITVH